MATAINTILAKIGARLANITITNEYNYTFKKIQEGMLKPFAGYDLPAINYWCTSLANERTVYDDDNRVLDLVIEAFSMTRDEPFTRVVSKLAADIVTGLNRATGSPAVSDSPSYDLGETVTELIFDSYDYEIGEGQDPWCGALLRFTIKYRTNPNEMVLYGV